MKIQEFEQKIQNEIDKELEVRVNPNIEDMAGVYYRGIYTGCAVPGKEIYEDHRPGYTNDMGYPHKNSVKAEMEIKSKLAKLKKGLQEDPDLYDPIKFKKYTK
jgi:hypothetical protein